MNQEDITNWRDRLNEIHDEMQVHADAAWNKIISDDVNSVISFEENVDKKETVRRGRHVLDLIESGIDNLDIMLKLNS